MRKMSVEQYGEAGRLLKDMRYNTSLLYDLMMKVDRRVDADKLSRFNLELDSMSFDLDRRMMKEYPDAKKI